MGNESTRFKKGQSGNPGGRPKTTGFLAEIDKIFGVGGVGIIKLLAAVAKDTKHHRQTDALKLLSHYRFGQPQAVQTDMKQAEPPAVTIRVTDGRTATPDTEPSLPGSETVPGGRGGKTVGED